MPPQRILKFVPWILLTALLILAAAFYFCDKKRNTVEGYFSAIRDGRTSEAYHRYTTDGFQQTTAWEDFEKFLEAHPEVRHGKLVALTTVEESPLSATLRGQLTSPNGEKATVDCRVIEVDGGWKVATMALLNVSNNESGADVKNELDAIRKPIELQLGALQAGDSRKAYYDPVSEGFQQVTSFQEFASFIRENRLFSEHETRELVSYDIDGNQAVVTFALEKGEERGAVEYQLRRMQSEWKIWSLKFILSSPEDVNGVPVATPQLAAIFEKLMEPVYNRQFSKAYYHNTAVAFKSHTSLEQFRSLIERNPALISGAPEYYQCHLNGNEAALKIYFRDAQPITARIALEREEGGWKIRALKVLDLPPPPLAFAPSPFVSFEDGSEDTIALYEPLPAPLSLGTDSEEPRPLLVVKRMLAALRNRATVAAYNDYTSRGFQQVNTLESFQKFVEAYPALASPSPQLVLKSSEPPGYATVSLTMTIREGEATGNFLLVDEGRGNWKILSIDIMSPQPIPSQDKEKAPRPTLSQEEDALRAVVERFLANLRHADFSASYRYYMSDEFQKTTSYEKFKATLSRLPVIAQGATSFTPPRLLNPSYGTLQVNFAGPYGQATLLFSLAKIGLDWKIFSLEISGSSSPTEQTPSQPVISQEHLQKAPEINTEDPTRTIQALLYMTSHGETNSSYFKVTAKEFQQMTTLDDYNHFIESYPIFTKNHSYRILSSDVEDDLATLRLLLNSTSGEKAEVIYDLTRQPDGWKILNIELSNYQAPRQQNQPKLPSNGGGQKESTATTMTPVARLLSHPPILSREGPAPLSPPHTAIGTPPKSTSSLSISYGAFGIAINNNGLVEKPTLTIPKGQSDIYFNLYVENASQGDKLFLDFHHMNSGVSIPQISSTIRSDGATTMSYIFSPPPGGWPEGIYQVDVRAENGAEKSFVFRVQ